MSPREVFHHDGDHADSHHPVEMISVNHRDKHPDNGITELRRWRSLKAMMRRIYGHFKPRKQVPELLIWNRVRITNLLGVPQSRSRKAERDSHPPFWTAASAERFQSKRSPRITPTRTHRNASGTITDTISAAIGTFTDPHGKYHGGHDVSNVRYPSGKIKRTALRWSCPAKKERIGGLTRSIN